MSRADPSRLRASAPKKAEPDDGIDDEAPAQAADRVPQELEEEELADELAEESGLDLTDASDLDADNVPADEEFDRVRQAPD